MSQLQQQINQLQERLKRLQAGEELCDHHWNGSDKCYETYCTGCQKHTGECPSEDSIPFKADNYCYSCRQTPEEKEQLRLLNVAAIQKANLITLASLIKQYPEEAENLLRKTHEQPPISG